MPAFSVCGYFGRRFRPGPKSLSWMGRNLRKSRKNCEDSEISAYFSEISANCSLKETVVYKGLTYSFFFVSNKKKQKKSYSCNLLYYKICDLINCASNQGPSFRAKKQVSGLVLWNSLPEDIRNSGTVAGKVSQSCGMLHLLTYLLTNLCRELADGA